MTDRWTRRQWTATVRSGVTRVAERPGLTVFLIALTVRLVLATVVAARWGGVMFQDDFAYLKMAGSWSSAGIRQLDADSRHFFQSHISFLGPIGMLFRMFGAKPILAQAISAVAGAATAVCVVTIARRHTRPKVALAAGLLAALFPSQVLWSSLVLRDSAAWMALSGLAVAFSWWTRRADPRSFVTGLTAVAALQLYLLHLRIHTLLIASLAIVIASALTRSSLRTARTVAAIALLITIPTLSDAGLAGHRYWRIGTSGLVELRQAGADGALTAIVPGVTTTTTATTATTATTIDHEEPDSPTLVDDLGYLPTGIRVMLLDPLPTHLGQGSRTILAFAEHLIWYPTLLLAVWGLRGLRSRSPDLIYAFITSVGLVTMWAFVEGNFGTAYRHRGEFVWAAIVFAAVGAEDLLRQRRNETLVSPSPPS